MLAMLGPALNIAVGQFRREMAKRGETVVTAELAANLTAMLDQLPPDDARVAVAVLCQVRQVREQSGAPVRV